MWPVTGSFQRKSALALILAVSLGPVVQGFECLSCSSDKNAPDFDPECESKVPKRTETCTGAATGCIFQTAANGRFVKRGCVDIYYIRCVDHTLNVKLDRGRCVVKENLSPASWDAFKSCDRPHMRSSEEGQEEPIGNSSEAVGTDAEDPKGRQVVLGRSGAGGTNVDICLCSRTKCNNNIVDPRPAQNSVEPGGNMKAGIALAVLIFAVRLIQ